MKPVLAALRSDSATRAALRALAVRADFDSAHLDGPQTHRMLALWSGLLFLSRVELVGLLRALAADANHGERGAP